MPKLHVLSGGNNQYMIVVHAATPAGNNAAGVAWTEIALHSGLVSALQVGTGAGQILQAEADQIVAGTLLEGSFSYWDDVTLTPAQRLAALDAVSTAMVTQLLADFQAKYKFYGMTRT